MGNNKMRQSWRQSRAPINVKAGKQESLKSARGQMNRRGDLPGWNEMETAKIKEMILKQGNGNAEPDDDDSKGWSCCNRRKGMEVKTEDACEGAGRNPGE